MPRLLLLIPSESYRTTDFLNAAERLGIDVVVGADARQALEEVVPGKTLSLDFHNPQEAVEKAVRFFEKSPFQAVVSTDEGSTVLAAMISEALSLPHNPVSATVAAKDKHRLREILTAASIPNPPFQLFSTEDPAREIAEKVLYPCVLKPTFLSASRGVIRANNPKEFVSAFDRLLKILNDPEVKRQGASAAKKVLVERFISGKEVALEGLLRKGTLSLLALFDKPDPLDGPFFEETIYVTPSRLPDSVQKKIVAVAERAAEALGLKEGPIHAELRVNDQSEDLALPVRARGVRASEDLPLLLPQGSPHPNRGAWVIEVAARSIGGLCSRTLRIGAGLSLEEVILRHALGLPIPSLEREGRAAGVMMIPIPGAGILADYNGVAEAKKVSGIEDVKITIHRKQKVIPLPEGRRYLGFIFAKGERPEEVEAALREAHRKLKFCITPRPPVPDL